MDGGHTGSNVREGEIFEMMRSICLWPHRDEIDSRNSDASNDSEKIHLRLSLTKEGDASTHNGEIRSEVGQTCKEQAKPNESIYLVGYFLCWLRLMVDLRTNPQRTTSLDDDLYLLLLATHLLLEVYDE